MTFEQNSCFIDTAWNSVCRNCDFINVNFANFIHWQLNYLQSHDPFSTAGRICNCDVITDPSTYYWIAMKKPRAMETLIFLIAIVIDQGTHDWSAILKFVSFGLDYFWRQVNGNVSKKFLVVIKMWSIIKIDEKRTLHLYFPFDKEQTMKWW